MQRNAGPGDPLHVRHRRSTVDVGTVPFVLRDNAEDPEWGRVRWRPCRDRGLRDRSILAEQRDLLPIDRHNEVVRPLRWRRVKLGATLMALGFAVRMRPGCAD